MAGPEHAVVRLSVHAWRLLFADAYRRPQIEACGALLGYSDEAGGWHVEEVCPLRNLYASPVYFEFAPEELLEVELQYPGRMVGVYHSHPTGFAVASATDRENMRRVNVEERIPWVWLILKGPFTEREQAQPGAAMNLPMIAYYHDELSGLREIPVQLEEE